MIFVDASSAIDKEALRLYASDLLKTSKESILKSLESKLWNELHDLIGTMDSDEEKVLLHASESQIIGLPYFVSSYLKTSLDSKERFELFIQLKAVELKSNNEKHNYFWALQIRHDQIIALARVLESLTKQIAIWSKQPPKEVLIDPIFVKLAETSIEDQVYLEAENVYKERKGILNS